jgi:tetratricopeptide (TPR) repeat protein
MTDDLNQSPMIDQLYQKYLHNEDSASFVSKVCENYTLGTLERLARFGRRISRRASVLAIGFIGDYNSNDILGYSLHDKDRAVRLLADHGIRLVWFRIEDLAAREKLQTIYRLNQCHQFGEAIIAADELIAIDDNIAEVWNQRGISNYALENYYECCGDCWRALELNPYQFSAALGLGHCHMQMNEVADALDCFRVAIDINPDLENVRAQINHLQRILEGK